MAYHRTRGVVLRCTPYSETSQVAAILTPDLGQIHVLAKGSRRVRKDGRLPLDLLNELDIVVARRQAGQLHILTEWHLRDNFRQTRAELKRLWAGFYATEIALETTSENPDDGPVYDALLMFLKKLESGGDSDRELCFFLSRALTTVGSAPATNHCAQCGRELFGATRFSPAAGGALCQDCAAHAPEAFGISRGALAIMSRLAVAGGGGMLRITSDQAHEIERAFNEQIKYHLGKPLKTERFLFV